MSCSCKYNALRKAKVYNIIHGGKNDVGQQETLNTIANAMQAIGSKLISKSINRKLRKCQPGGSKRGPKQHFLNVRRSYIDSVHHDLT